MYATSKTQALNPLNVFLVLSFESKLFRVDSFETRLEIKDCKHLFLR